VLRRADAFINSHAVNRQHPRFQQIHALPSKEGEPVVSTLAYAGDVVTQVTNPAIRHPTGCLMPPINNLNLARRLRTLFTTVRLSKASRHAFIRWATSLRTLSTASARKEESPTLITSCSNV
jgi:hypothetical protein